MHSIPGRGGVYFSRFVQQMVQKKFVLKIHRPTKNMKNGFVLEMKNKVF